MMSAQTVDQRDQGIRYAKFVVRPDIISMNTYDQQIILIRKRKKTVGMVGMINPKMKGIYKGI